MSGRRRIEEDLFSRYSIVDNNSAEGKKVHAFLFGPNAFFCDVFDPEKAPKPSDYETVMTEKFGEYAKQKRQENRMSRRRWRDDKDDGINWSEVLDVHMTGENRKAGIEASLTRLSHLIDDREPTDIDKSTFDTEYSDPVDAYLKDHNFETQKSLGKLKVLIDCVDHISSPVPAKQFFDAELVALDKEDDWDVRYKKEAAQKCIDDDYDTYYKGAVIDKKYQQKITRLAEKVVSDVENEREKNNPHKPAIINAKDLTVYLEDAAYAHIGEYGYPKAGDYNYFQSAGILYSYFHCLLENNSHLNPKPRRLKDMFAEQETEARRVRSKIEIDLEGAKDTVRSTNNLGEFTSAVQAYESIATIIHEIRTIEFGQNGSYEKLDNLSGVKSHRYRFRENREEKQIYPELSGASIVPWNNLYEITQANDKAKEQVSEFLESQSLSDYRITHGLPYVQFGRNNGYVVDENGMMSKDTIPAYQISYEVHKDTVEAAYDYIGSYFNDEDTLIEKACADVIGMTDDDWTADKKLSDHFDRKTKAHKKIYDFVSMFNALPDESEEGRSYSDNMVVEMIPENYAENNLMPGSTKARSSFGRNISYEFDRDLLKFDNPVFKERFGDNYKQELTQKKKTQHDRMFETAFTLFQQSIDNSIDSRAKRDALKSQEDQYWDEVESAGETRWDHKKSDRIEAVRAEQEFHKEKLDQSESIIYNFLQSIFEGREKYWYHLQRLTDAQRITLAEYAIRDETGEIRKVIKNEKYEFVCDFLDILEQQTDQVINGDYSLTPMMEIVADNYGYTSPQTVAIRLMKSHKNEQKMFLNY